MHLFLSPILKRNITSALRHSSKIAINRSREAHGGGKLPKRVLHGREQSKRSVGKPRKGWEDSIEAHSKGNAKRRISLDPDDLRRVFEEARA